MYIHSNASLYSSIGTGLGDPTIYSPRVLHTRCHKDHPGYSRANDASEAQIFCSTIDIQRDCHRDRISVRKNLHRRDEHF